MLALKRHGHQQTEDFPMASLNRVMIIGNLGQDPELRYTQNQTAVCTLNIATTDSRVGADGQKKDFTEWHRVVVWSRQAENCAKYLAKGRPVFVEGRLQTRSWEDQNGNKRYTTEIVAQNIQFLGSAGGAQRDIGGDIGVGEDFGGGSAPYQGSSAGGGRPKQAQASQSSFGGDDHFGGGLGGPDTPGLDDIPF